MSSRWVHYTYTYICHQESSKCPPVEYIYDMDLDLGDGETINETVEVDYEYSYDINVRDNVNWKKSDALRKFPQLPPSPLEVQLASSAMNEGSTMNVL